MKVNQLWNNRHLVTVVEEETLAGRGSELMSLLSTRVAQLTNTSNHSFVLMSDNGYWARGDTLQEARDNIIKEGARKSNRVAVKLVLNDKTPYVDGGGYINGASAASIVDIGTFKIGGIL